VLALGKNSKTLVQIFLYAFFYVSRVTNLTTPRSTPGLMLKDQMNEFSVYFERLILGTFAKGSEHLKINSLYFCKYVVYGQGG
jgi:hypothetical protein